MSSALIGRAETDQLSPLQLSLQLYLSPHESLVQTGLKERATTSEIKQARDFQTCLP